MDDLIAGFKINDLTNNEAIKSNIGIKECHITVNKKGDLPILYTDSTKKTDREGSEITAEHSSSNDVYGIPRTVMMSFLTDVVTILLDDENIERIVEMSWTKKTPLHMEAMEHQRDIMVRTCVCVRERDRQRVCVCVCVYMYVCVCVCV